MCWCESHSSFAWSKMAPEEATSLMSKSSISSSRVKISWSPWDQPSRAMYQVVHDRRARVRDPEAERPGIQAAVAAPPRVAESLLARLGGPPLALQELGRAVAVVGAARGAQSLGVVTVDRKPLGLAVA